MSDINTLDSVFKQINKIYGDGSVGNLGTMPKQQVEVIPTGSVLLNEALGVGGYPKGRIIEIYGPEASGKTTLAIHALSEVQKSGGVAGFIDMEHAFDPEYATNLGVDIDQLVFSQPEHGEQAWETLDMLVSSSLLDLIVIDSIAAMVPKRELEGDMGDAVIGLQAKMMAQGLRKNVGKIKKSDTTVIFINQIRDNVGVMYGPSEITTGGKSMKFYASQRLEIRKIENVMQGDKNQVGNRVRVKVAKNKVAPPFKMCFLTIVFGVGIDKVAELIEIAVEFDIVKRSGSWYSFQETKLGQGIQGVRTILDDNPELYEMIEELVYTKLNS